VEESVLKSVEEGRRALRKEELRKKKELIDVRPREVSKIERGFGGR